MEKHCNNPQYFKEKNYKVKFLTSSLSKKVKSTKIIFLKNKQKKAKVGKKRKVILKIKIKNKKKRESWKKKKKRRRNAL